MQRKLAGYVLLSFLSFSVATTLFHTVANAQEIEPANGVMITPSPTPLPPLDAITPTLPPVKFTLKSVTIPSPTVTPIEEEPEKKSDPTTKPQQSVVTPTPTTVITAAPTVAPTATPQPTAVPVSKPAVAAPADLDPIFDKYAGEYGIDKEDLKGIAKCEAGFNPNAGNGPYVGMYQFMEQTWISTRNSMGLDPNPDLRRNAEESIKTAAFKIKNGGRGAWPNC